jgi:hypothetical protein
MASDPLVFRSERNPLSFIRVSKRSCTTRYEMLGPLVRVRGQNARKPEAPEKEPRPSLALQACEAPRSGSLVCQPSGLQEPSWRTCLAAGAAVPLLAGPLLLATDVRLRLCRGDPPPAVHARKPRKRDAAHVVRISDSYDVSCVSFSRSLPLRTCVGRCDLCAEHDVTKLRRCFGRMSQA